MSPQPPPPRQYSPDGNYYWDGQAWQPAAAQPTAHGGQPGPFPAQPVPPAGQPAGAPMPGSPPGAGAGGLRGWSAEPPVPARRRDSLVAPVIGIVLGCGAVGALAGFVLAVVTAPQPVGPSAPPAIPADFPNAEKRYLPGVTVSRIADDWMKKANSYTCKPHEVPATNVEEGRAPKELECSAPGDAKWDLYTSIEYDDEKHVRAVEAHCHYGPGSVACSSLFATMADAIFTDPELRKRAATWAEKNADADNETVIGGVRFRSSLENPHSLRAMPEPG